MSNPAEALDKLLQIIYPKPYGLDILTRELIKKRFQFTQFGRLAQEAIDRSERIVMASNDYDQMGLFAFQVGLIYLEYGSHRGAAEQFVQARTKWSFASKTAGECLALYGQAKAMQVVYQLERAAILVNRAERKTRRLEMSPPSAEHALFAEELLAAIAQTQKELDEQLRPAQPAPAEPATAETAPAADEAADSAEAESVPPAAAPSTSGGDGPPVRPAIAPLPESHLSSDPITPVDGHKKINDDYHWYQVVYRTLDDFLNEFTQNSWVLINTNVTTIEEGEGPVALKHTYADASVQAEPRSGIGERICLADVQLTGGFERSDNKVKLNVSPYHSETIDLATGEILGSVIGIWHKAPLKHGDSPF